MPGNLKKASIPIADLLGYPKCFPFMTNAETRTRLLQALDAAVMQIDAGADTLEDVNAPDA